MAPKNRPQSRKKNVGKGVASVSKRGSGLGNKVSKPVGRTSSSQRQSRPSRPRPSTSSSYRSSSGSGLSLKTIFFIGIIVVVLFLVFKGCGSDDSSLLSDGSFISDETSGVDTSLDLSSGYDVSRQVSDLARDKRTILQGNGNDTVTLMIYLLGTDLETKSSMATKDLMEIVNAEISDQVNIIIETGGTKKWNNDIISNETNQRYQVTSEGLILLEEDLGKKSMVDPDTLSDFIQYCSGAYPADRYQLIMWDHGGGSLTGYGYDEYYPTSHMTLDKIKEALEDGGTAFDFIGFDACLMATLETAMVLEPYADYMIASEETEPGIGWYYTDWISLLSENTSIPTVDLGKQLIDDYVMMVEQETPSSQATLSLIDLAELKGTVPESLTEFAQSTNALIDEDNYQVVSDARAGTKEFSKAHKLNQIDLIDFATLMNTEESLMLAETLSGAIKYNRTSDNISNANGVSIYFPYNSLSKLNSMLDTYEEIDMGDEYSACIKSFANVAVGGQVASAGSGNMLSSLLGSVTGGSDNNSGMVGGLISSFISSGNLGSILGTSNEEASWVDPDMISNSTEYYENNLFDTTQLVITEKNGESVLALSEDQWDLVQYMELNVFIDDGEGYIDLGLDNVFEYNNDGDLIMEYDETWLTLNGQVVSYYMVSEDYNGDSYSIKGRIPAFLNGELVDIIVTFDNASPYGRVDGVQISYNETGESDAIAKGLIEINPGDQIDYICDYYTYDGEYIDSYYLGDSYYASDEWVIENLSVAAYDYKMTYRITDIYNNHYWTPSIAE